MKKLIVFVLACVLLLSTAAFAADAPALIASADSSSCNHFYEATVTKEATCTEKGVITYTCTECGNSFSVETLPVGHNYKVEVVAPTCESAGYTLYTCVNCGDSYAEDAVPALGHSFSEAVVPASCGVDGWITRTCSVCGVVETEVIPAEEHQYVYQNDAVVGADGSIVSYGTKVCSVCGAVTPASADDYVAPAAPASGEASAEPAGAPSGDASAEPAAAPAVSNPDYNPDAYNWAIIEIILVVAIIVVGAVLMLSFGKKKEEVSDDPLN